MVMIDKKKKVLEYMREVGKPLKTGDIAKAINLDSKEVSAIIKKLKKEGKVDSPKRCYYAPKE